jgi:hypothetical protein
LPSTPPPPVTPSPTTKPAGDVRNP